MGKENSARHVGGNVPANYQRYFVPVVAEPLAVDLLHVAKLQQGERVLDVGCGTGVVARLAAHSVATNGSVVGVDPNPGMLAVARDIDVPGITIDWREAGAEKLPFEDATFDVVLSQMSLQFVADRKAALDEMHRVLVPGGRLVINLPGPPTKMFTALADAVGRHIHPEAARFVLAVFSLHDPAEVEHLLQDAGFHDVSVHAEVKTLVLPQARDFLWQYLGSTPLSEHVAKAGDPAKGALERDVVSAWRDFEDGDGLRLEQRMLTAAARA